MSNAFGVTSSAIKGAELTKSTSIGQNQFGDFYDLQTDMKSYMDSDRNPHKKSMFKADTYLTQFKMQTDDDQIGLYESTVREATENDEEILPEKELNQDTLPYRPGMSRA